MKYLFACLLFCFTLIAQTKDSVPHSTVRIYNSTPKDFAFFGETLYYLTAGDSLIRYNISRKKVEAVVKNVQAFTLDKNGVPLYASVRNVIKWTGNKFKRIFETPHAIYNLVSDKNGNVLAKTATGIYYNGKNYLFTDEIVKYVKPIYKNPDVFFIDSNDRLWMAYDMGEWGGELVIFDCKEKAFLQAESLNGLYYHKYYTHDRQKVDKATREDHFKEFPDLVLFDNNTSVYQFPYEIDSYYIKGIAEDERGKFLISHSLMHFFVNGYFSILEPKLKSGFYEEKQFDDVLEKETVNGQSSVNEYLGPVAFNQFDNHFYYYTNNGFFKIIENTDGSFKKEFIVRAWATWTSGMAHSVGYQMNVSKFQFINGKEFLFQTSNNGIGHYTGTQIIYYK